MRGLSTSASAAVPVRGAAAASDVGGQLRTAMKSRQSRPRASAGPNTPLPPASRKLRDVSCPTGLKAVEGARMTCTGELTDGESVPIPVRVDAVGNASITWSFER